jgi:tetratricopeptide (TPR) repeat protein
MQKLISMGSDKTTFVGSEDHYIIDNISQITLNKDISELFLQANDCVDDENFLEALKFYDLILKEDSKNISALIDKGITLQNLGRIKSAIRYYDKAITISPNNLDALINKGSAFHLNEQYIDAIGCYDLALQIDKKCSMALAYKGLSLGESGKLSEAIDYFKKALSIDKHYDLAQMSKDTAQDLLNSLKEKKSKIL